MSQRQRLETDYVWNNLGDRKTNETPVYRHILGT